MLDSSQHLHLVEHQEALAEMNSSLQMYYIAAQREQEDNLRL